MKLPTVKIRRSTFERIKLTIGKIPAEQGGILLGNRDRGDREKFVIEEFVFDNAAKTSSGTYTFNHEFLNKILKAAYPKYQLVGYIHSHPPHCRALSTPDRIYFTEQFNYIDTDKFITPIVISEADTGRFELIPYVTYRDDPFNPKMGVLEIIEDEEADAKKKAADFSRIEKAVNVPLLQKSNIVIVGAGGSFSLCESLVRSGVKKLTVIDFDTVDETNVVRQGYYPDDFGQLKIKALGDHLKRLNPTLKFRGLNQDVTTLSKLQREHIFGKADILLFLTDSFKAQAFGNTMALEYQKPTIWAGYYEGSRCAEVFFYIPDVTPACFRCAVSSRYKAQEEAKNEIKASSAKNTIFHSQYLDSVIGMLSMAILHNDTEGFEYSNWFGKKWDRNFFQLRVHPEHSHEEGNLFHRTFKGSPDGSIFNFNAVFQTVEPELPPKYEPCPDCGHLHKIEPKPENTEQDVSETVAS